MNKQKHFAIVDIETTGSHAGGSRITEVAILIHNGKKVIERYQSLVNPQCPIPFAIQMLTGITPDMLADVPTFDEIAEDVYHLLQGRIFVAHNVNFDYSFLVKELKQAGYDWQAPKLCTVRLSRKIFPGHRSYSLGDICKVRDINITERHRAMGDAEATSELFSQLLLHDDNQYLQESLHKNTEHRLPTHLSLTQFQRLPETTGIYIFRNKKGKILYIGKAVNIQKRVLSHFGGINTSLRRQQFINDIATIDFEESGTELMALLMECQLIKKHWPIHNRALKRYEPKFALIHYEDIRGYSRLAISKATGRANSIRYFETAQEANVFLTNLLEEFNLAPTLCTFYSPSTETREDRKICVETLPSLEEHNQTIDSVFQQLGNRKRSFLLIDRGRNEEENSYVYFKEDKLYAFGFVELVQQWSNVEDIVSYKDKCISNFYMQQIVLQYAERHPEKVTILHQDPTLS
ncbi:DNA polymerase III subunit epsilon [Sphingobacterium phlebotomi]|uniref:DNA polymerase III subunit epsilon n=1 Tax=Sphingobacterium phlebotomi TaxID=2605433 RepID=A0A5D4H6X3_9SPHI|nr:exonuclease domain-containing protein [Sphingobacterium phlebotomi]TYR36516.1 DNA polymerase III subunit epsilon [Sphingobacterium phlebotomi]